ncbi:aspartate/glutamate racemase family protein [Butyrivibrio fibrisolvens]|uniref:aspartate/glutamate racemase family protein n=1 Tax=Butyrivibrio fibrisolvens TaxID=831 RepID=UPI0004194B48|nr:aspartate/glutamate racemase family protein [Butyrivibrio fibrisolvens]
MKNYTIGIVGLASYATVDLMRRIVNAFPAEKEWDRPRIIVDNNCLIPSRVRAILYEENTDLVIKGMSRQISYLIEGKADRIIVDCNTAHYFLPEVCQQVKGAKEKVINIIQSLSDYIYEKYGEVDVGMLASEGVIETKIYDNTMKNHNIIVHSLDKQRYADIRRMIEAVKQSKIDKQILEEFKEMIMSFPYDYIILGCTELPVLYDEVINSGFVFNKVILDPLDVAITFLKREYQELPDVGDFAMLQD